MNNTGQCCVAGKRFIVAEELADRFLAKFHAALAALMGGAAAYGHTRSRSNASVLEKAMKKR